MGSVEVIKKADVFQQRLAGKLLTDGVISEGAHEEVLRWVNLHGGRVEDILIDRQFVDEALLLKHIATLHRTRYVSTEKLYRAQIDSWILARVPAKLCELYGVFPILFDGQQTLTLATSDPDDLNCRHEVKATSGARSVHMVIARPAAVRAAIARSYHHSPERFVSLMRGTLSGVHKTPVSLIGHPAVPSAQAPSSQTVTQLKGVAPTVANRTAPPSPPSAIPVNFLRETAKSLPVKKLQMTMTPVPFEAQAVRAAEEQMRATQASKSTLPSQGNVSSQSNGPVSAPIAIGRIPLVGVVRAPVAPSTLLAAQSPASGASVPRPNPPSATLPAPALSPAGATPSPSTGVRIKSHSVRPGGLGDPLAQRGLSGGVAGSLDYTETVKVFVGLLDAARSDLRGHSAAVARFAETLAERVGLPREHVAEIVLGAYIHDLGKSGAYHLTALNVAKYENHRAAAQKVAGVGLEMLSLVDLSEVTRSTVSSMYERYDGNGFPAGLSAKEIPLGARILAVADAYTDLTQNPRNPARRELNPAEACAVLAENKGTIFDPTIVDLLLHFVSGEDIRARLLSDRAAILLVDPDPEDITVLELRLIEQGFTVKSARTFEQAMEELGKREVVAVVSEVDLDSAEAGIKLRSEGTKLAWGRDLVWVIHTKKTGVKLAQSIFDMGVDDFVTKSTGADVVAAKLKQLVDKKRLAENSQRGVAGSLAELALPDMIQVLFHGRKTCVLRVQTDGDEGEIFFTKGQVVDAKCGELRGEEAVYRLLAYSEGNFRIDPNAQTLERTIRVSPEALLLEGMRRLDETTMH